MKFGQLIPALSGGLALVMLVIFTNCTTGEKPSFSEEKKAEYLQKGKEISAAAFAALSSQLAVAIQKGGPPAAIEYCQLEALPITDSLSKAFNVTLRRTSKKLRNKANRPTDWELEVLDDYQKMLEHGEEPQPRVFQHDQQVVFTAPIRVLPQCLVCHGQPGQDIAPETLETLAQRYPEDLAKGYKTGELRGIWSVSFHSQ